MNSDGVKIKGEAKTIPIRHEDMRTPAIACFIDGTGCDHPSGSNIQIMWQEASKHNKAPNPQVDDRPLVQPLYSAGPGAGWSHLFGKMIAGNSITIAQNAYRRIVQYYVNFKRTGKPAPHIDIYGFSRGAAIANEVAWMVEEFGIRLDDKSPVCSPHTVKIRFLGLFDTVYSIGGPNFDTSNKFHTNQIAPCVEAAAHALAADETRTYFIPSILDPSPGKRRPSEMIFPGTHSDVGGYLDNNHYIMMLTRSWISQNAAAAGVDYLNRFILSDRARTSLLRDRRRTTHGSMGFPPENLYKNDANPLYTMHKIGAWRPGQPLPSVSIGQLYTLPVLEATDAVVAMRMNSGVLDTYENQPPTMHMPRTFPEGITWARPEDKYARLKAQP